MNVVPFPPPRRPRRTPLRPPAALDDYRPAAAPSNTLDEAEERLRMQQNLGALIAVVIIVGFGTWLMDRLAAFSHTMICIEAGHRNCMPLQVEQTRPWDR